jgi:hypothetical protein
MKLVQDHRILPGVYKAKKTDQLGPVSVDFPRQNPGAGTYKKSRKP